MNIVLTHAYFLQDDIVEQKIMKPYPPLGILYISSHLEKNNISHSVFDTTFSSKAIFKETLLKDPPDIIAFYVNLMTKLNVLEMIDFILSSSTLKSTKIVLGGPDVKYNAKELLEHGADYLVVGEGEETTLELIVSLKTGTILGLKDINGLIYKDRSGTIIENPERAKIRDINELSFPNRQRIDLFQYMNVWKKHHGLSTVSISSMRGCPYTCKWCSRAVYGLSYRRRSPELIAKEIKYLHEEYNPDALWFVDDVFTISHKWLNEFRDALTETGIKIPYECITRADRMNDEVIQLLKETGCYRVWIGAESGSQNVINLMDRRVDVEQVRKMIRLAETNGIEAGTFIMLGYPGETEEDIENTIHHLKESNPTHFTITLAYPIKGTELHNETMSIQTNDLDWAKSTDRDIDFKRTYSRNYYNHALRRVINEVNFFKSKHESGISLLGLKYKIKSLIAKSGMWWERKLGHYEVV